MSIWMTHVVRIGVVRTFRTYRHRHAAYAADATCRQGSPGACARWTARLGQLLGAKPAWCGDRPPLHTLFSAARDGRLPHPGLLDTRRVVFLVRPDFASTLLVAYHSLIPLGRRS